MARFEEQEICSCNEPYYGPDGPTDLWWALQPKMFASPALAKRSGHIIEGGSEGNTFFEKSGVPVSAARRRMRRAKPLDRTFHPPIDRDSAMIPLFSANSTGLRVTTEDTLPDGFSGGVFLFKGATRGRPDAAGWGLSPARDAFGAARALNLDGATPGPGNRVSTNAAGNDGLVSRPCCAAGGKPVRVGGRHGPDLGAPNTGNQKPICAGRGTGRRARSCAGKFNDHRPRIRTPLAGDRCRRPNRVSR